MENGKSLVIRRAAFEGKDVTPEQWQRLKSLYAVAEDCAIEERSTILDQVGAEDPEICAQLRVLLEHRAQTDDFLEQPIARLGSTPAAPTTIGRYRILRLLGEGGMGTVYEAEQDQPRRTVALKVIKPGFAGPGLLWRFELEAEALGRLHHAGIAQIYEGGTADTGYGLQPYFAMELIRGEPLLEYAEQHHLNVRQRLELMAKVCEAVQHAHQRSIIHRDLKPGNILVEESGQPKVLDFGVARVTNSDAQATCQTDVGQLVGTLAYMSPEQVLADPLDLDTRSDVYALGVILFELLAGRLPYQISCQLPEAVRMIREEEPTPLSSLDRMYRGDIETIVGKALEKDRARRYSSSADLAGDIQRYLRDEPITARRPSATYQLQKFVRRHKAFMLGLSIVFAVLVAGIIASSWQATRARRAEESALQQRDRAAAAERIAAAVNDFLQNDVLAQASANVQARPGTRPDKDLTVRAALDRAAVRVTGKFSAQPLIEASIRQTIGNTYTDLALYPEAQQQIKRALDLRKRVLGNEHPDTLTSMYYLAFVYWKEGQDAEAEPVYKKVLQGRRRVLGDAHPDTLISMHYLGVLYLEEGKYAQAEPLFNSVLKTRRHVLARNTLTR